jgi:hypothetical protein
MVLSFVYLAFASLLRLLAARRRATGSPKTLSCSCCDTSSLCCVAKRTAQSCGPPTAPCSQPSPACSRIRADAAWW